ncbi:MAG: hypothetical protein PHZ00_06340 [Candidatus Peribacteraceae bacterium]|nr:hypothetical protein [Candidatus Peribacteraceae bacterium]
MDLSANKVEGRSITMATGNEQQTATIVFQPPRLSQIVEIVDVMGNVVESIREENARDLPVTLQKSSAGSAAGTATVSTRDAAIAAAPPVPVMQKRLVKHLKKEVRIIEREVRKLSRSRARGSAYVLSILYRKIRRLSSLIGEILRASTEVIKRFYVAVFIDHQPLVVRGGTLAPSDE